jgi:hypothetical protein
MVSRNERHDQIFEETLKMHKSEPRLKCLYNVYAERLGQEHPDIKPMSEQTFVRKAKQRIKIGNQQPFL